MLKLKPFCQTAGLCGPASLKIVLAYYGVSVSESKIAKIAGASKEKGAWLIKAAKHFGFQVFSKENSSPADIKYFIKKKIPVIVDWFLEDDGHYSVAVDIDKKILFWWTLLSEEKEGCQLRNFWGFGLISRESLLKNQRIWF